MRTPLLAAIGAGTVAANLLIWRFVHRATKNPMPTPPGHEHQGTAVPQEGEA